MERSSRPVLSDWAIIRTDLVGQPRPIRYHFTGIVHGHPNLPDDVQIVTTEVQEIGKDGKWGRTRSRTYRLRHHLSRREFTPELAFEVWDILRYELSRTYNVGGISIGIEWISIKDWRIVAAGEEGDEKAVKKPADSHLRPDQEPVAPKSDEEVEAILAGALERGKTARKLIIASAGGLLTTRQAAVVSGLRPEELEQRMNTSLLAVPMGRRVGWPQFQFESHEMMSAIGKVMARIGVRSPLMQINFFLMHLDELGGVRPIDAIREGNVEAVEIAASHYGVHGGS